METMRTTLGLKSLYRSLVPRGRVPFGQHQESRPLARSNDISVLNGLVKHNRLRPEAIRFVKLDSEHSQSDGKSVNRGLPSLDQAGGEVAILGADQKECSL